MSTLTPKSLHVPEDENLCIVDKSETKSHNPPTYKGKGKSSRDIDNGLCETEVE